MSDQNKIIAKIQKLLNHAKDGAAGAEAERDTAMRMALKLMTKHNLSMDKVSIENKEDRDELLLEQFPDPYRTMIGHAIAELFFCKFFRTKVPGKQKYNFHFVGLESNAITAREMTLYAIKSVSDESNRAQRDAGGNAGWGTTFRNGAALKISQRCFALRKEAEETKTEDYLKDVEDDEPSPVSTGTALVLSNVYQTEADANDSFIEKVLGIQVKKKKLNVVNKSNNALSQGLEYGDKVNLSKQVGTNAPAPKIGN
jgi:hypothetical protein